jgi:hypothetical protein
LNFYRKKLTVKDEKPTKKSKRKTTTNENMGFMVGLLGFEPRIAYAPGTYPKPC